MAALRILCSFAITFLGVSVEAEEKRILFTNLTAADGIGGGEIRSIMQDRRGYMWFATQAGLNRYDGYEIRVFRHTEGITTSLSGDEVTTICEGSQGWIWVGTKSQGLNRYDPALESFIRIGGPESEFGDSEVTTILETSDDVLWFGTRSGLCRLNRNGLKRERIRLAKPDPSAPGGVDGSDSTELMVETLFEDGRETLWVGTRSEGLCFLEKESGELRQVWNGGVGIASVAEDEHGRLWVGTLGGGIVLIDPEAKSLIGPLDAKGLPGRDVGPIYRDSSGTIWVGMRQGLCRYDAEADAFEVYRHDSETMGSPVQGGIRSLYEDKKRVLWAGGSSGGISRFSLDGYWFEHQHHRPGDEATIAENSVWAFLENEDGTVWVGTEGGLDLYDPNTGKIVRRVQGDRPCYVSALARGINGEIFVGTKGEGVRIFNPETGEFFPATESGLAVADGADVGDSDVADGGLSGLEGGLIRLDKGTVTALLVEETGRLFAGIEGSGLAILDSGAKTFRHLDLGLGSGARGTNFVTALEHGTQGSIWVGTMGGGLHRLDPKMETLMSFPVWAAMRGVRTSISENINSLALAGRSLWVGTSGHGINRVDLETGQVTRFATAPGGLPHGMIFGLVESASGLIWASTGSGLARIDPATLSFRRFDIHDGLQADVFHPRSSYRASDGQLFFGGPNGFNVIDPARLPSELKAQRPLLTGLELFGERVVPSKDGILRRPLPLTDVLELPFEKSKRVAFTFATLSYATPHRSRFRFRLEGLEAGWTTVDRDRKATYTALAPGKYTFHVQSTLGGEGWSGDTVSLPIVVLPPWYQTWWARASMTAGAILLVGLILAIILRTNFQRMRRRENELDMARSKAEAALSRQLQNAMLLEQTTDHIRHHLDGGKLFHSSLEQLCDHFKIDSCRLHRLDPGDGCLPLLAEHPEPEQGSDATPKSTNGSAPLESTGSDVSEIAEDTGTSPADPNLRMGSDLPMNDPFIRAVLRHDKAAGISEISIDSPFDSTLAEYLEGLGARSVAAVRTSYMGEANGLILLIHHEPKDWKPDEAKLLQAVAAQVGIALAQVKMASKEEKQREDLKAARQVADEANSAKSEFLAKMTHELRTPLNAILGFSRLLEEDKDTTSRQLKIINIVNSSGEHLLDIINDVLEMSKIESGKMELNEAPFDLCEMLDSVENMLGHKARSQGLRFAVVRENELPPVIDGDRGKLRQSLVNLLGNSIKFTESGAITVKVRAEKIESGGRLSQNVDPVTGSKKGGDVRLHFAIKDTGRGIAEDEISKLFQKFVQTDSGRKSHQGTGLGLAITAYFVEMMGGEIEVESEPGKGTEFRFAVTCRTADSTPMPSGRSSARRVIGLAPGQDRVRVLVAEDQMVNRMLLTRILRTAGFEIEEAENGAIAVAKWKSWHPHLIFMDQDMPIMKGDEATQAIIDQAGENRPAIVALTAYALDEARAAAMEAGCDDFLSKPFDKDELFEVIARHISVHYTYLGDKDTASNEEPVLSA